MAYIEIRPARFPLMEEAEGLPVKCVVRLEKDEAMTRRALDLRPGSGCLGRLKGPNHPASWTDGSRP